MRFEVNSAATVKGPFWSWSSLKTGSALARLVSSQLFGEVCANATKSQSFPWVGSNVTERETGKIIGCREIFGNIVRGEGSDHQGRWTASA